MTMLLPLFILVGFIAGYFVNVMAYHLSPLEDKTALTFRQVLVHFWQKKYAWHDTVPLILCVAAAIACALAPFTPIVTGALFLYFCFALTLSVIDFRTQLLPDKLTLPLLWLGLVAVHWLQVAVVWRLEVLFWHLPVLLAGQSQVYP